MLQDMILKEEAPSPMSAQIFEFCDSELFQETLQNSEVTSSSNCCYEDTTYTDTKFPLPPDHQEGFLRSSLESNCDTNTPKSALTTTTSNLSMIFDSPEAVENDISASIDFSPSPAFSIPPPQHYLPPTQQDQQFEFSSLQPQLQMPNVVVETSPAGPLYPQGHQPGIPLLGPHLLPSFEGDCLSNIPSYLRLDPSSPPCCSFLDASVASYMPGNLNNALSEEGSGMFSGANALMGADLQPQELDFPEDNGGIYCPDAMPRVFNPGELQALSNESQQMVNGGGGNPAPLTSEITSLEDSSNKVGKLSVEQRKEKIHRYMKKRNERNFSKKIKYACRKTLADSRPRVRGRFAKNDESPRTTSSTREDEDEEEVVVKEEEDMVDSTDIFSHISGVNSFNCNYPIQSWI